MRRGSVCPELGSWAGVGFDGSFGHVAMLFEGARMGSLSGKVLEAAAGGQAFTIGVVVRVVFIFVGILIASYGKIIAASTEKKNAA